MQPIALDDIDRRILRFLQENGRATNLEMAEVVGLSPAQCNRRHKRLEELGVIGRYEARLSTASLGLGVVAFIQISMERGHSRELPKFKALVADLPQVQECYAVTGNADYVLKVVTENLRSLSELLMDTLMRIPGVSTVHSTVCLDEVKCTSALPV